MGFKFNPLTGTLDLVNPKLDSPLLFKGSITAAADFPTSVEVKSGWFYTILADVTDNDGSKTNTGQSFFAGDEIAWNGSDWTALGNENVYVPYSGATSNVDLGVYSLTADALTLGTGTALTAGTFTDDTTLSFKANFNSGDDAFRMQFYESGTAESPTAGGYIQYNSDSNYLEYGGITTLGVDVPGFRIARDTGKPTFLATAEFQGGISGNCTFGGNNWYFNNANVDIAGNITNTPTFTGLTTFSNDVVFDDIVEFNSSVSSHLVQDTTTPAYLNINGPINGFDCSTLGLYESGGTSYGMYMKYDGAGNLGYIGMTNNSVQNDIFAFNRSYTYAWLPTGYLGIGTTPTYPLHIQNTNNRIRLAYDSGQYSDFYTSTTALYIYPRAGLLNINTASTNNTIKLTDNSTATSDYNTLSGRTFELTYDNDVKVRFSTLSTNLIKTESGFNRALRIGPNNSTVDDGSFIEFSSSSNDDYGSWIGGIRDGADGANALVIYTGKASQTERLRVSNDGNVGIGTTTPDEALDVVGNILAEELISVNSGTISRTSGVITSVAVTGGRTLTPTRTSGLITSITDGTRTWTFTYVDGLITAWTVS